MQKKTSTRGIPARIYFDSEANEELNLQAVELDMNRSNIVCALIRAMVGKSERTGEQKVYNKLKKVFGRDHMRAFFRAVAEVLGPDAEPLDKPPTSGEFIPCTWIASGVAVVAFFHPSFENLGDIFAQAIKAKNQTNAKVVLIVSPSAEVAPDIARATLRDAGIHIVSVSQLQKELKRLSKA